MTMMVRTAVAALRCRRCRLPSLVRFATSSSAASASASAAAAAAAETTTHFGFETVETNEKEGRVKQVFENVAESYDVMNDVMSGGLHRLWKDYFVKQTSVETMAQMIRRNHNHDRGDDDDDDNNTASSLAILDVAGGTGDIAFRIIEATGCLERSKSSGRDPVSITVCDINTEMLRVGERRARQRFGNALLDDTQALSFREGNAQDLVNFPDNSFDLYTIAFGLRNVTDVDGALREAYRVLKPGGRFLCLEFSQVPQPLLRSVYDMYSFHVIPQMGQLVANDRASYQYLVESIRKFSNQTDLVQRMEQAGFEGSTYTNLTGGIVAIHDGWKSMETK
mmetsp:Transcript_19532/g.33397  ORF Transcript_19532/g.33397 Transcript_19532/m.33397 type:complete len:337 (-) Transcript_19532:160-1170(-)